MRQYLLLIIALCLHIAARGQTIAGLDDIDLSRLPQPTMAKQLRYWFDDDTGSMKTTSQLSGRQTLDVSSLTEGFHSLHFQVIDESDAASSICSALFIKMGNGGDATVTAKKLMYWFDDETTITTIDAGQGVQMLDASHLMGGLHTIHYQVLCSNDMLTPVSSSLFMRMNNDAENNVARQLRYWFDDDASTLKVIDVASGTQTLDVSGLITGLHTLNYQLIGSEGKTGAPVTALFMKTFDKVIEGENRIMQYQYWLNSNSQAMQTVTLNNAANPYHLISLLPMQKEPIHSDCFQFEMTDGQPIIYAKNIFHIRFHDAAGYFADGDKPFVDYSVRQEVTDAELLNNGDHKDTARPVGNDIKWYRLTAEPGDSVQFRLDRAATVQLFAPSGEEILSASASEVVKWFGCHVRESGTYYVALHDVTATNGTTVGIDYEHIDKYAVLRQDVSVVGNGGCSTITFEGNGFRDLYAVDLFTEQGDSIHHVYIGHESDATTSVVFVFTDAVLGTYHAKFRFAEEDKTFSNIVTVEEARDIELATTVTYPSTFLRGTSTTYTIKIENKGNMTAYAVPLEIKLKASSLDDISEILFDGYISKVDIPEELMIDSIDGESILEIRQAIDKYVDRSQFLLYHDSIENVDYGVSFVFINLPPNCTKQINISFKSSSDINLTAYMSTEWYPLTVNHRNRLIRRISKEEAGAWLCCYRERIECVADIFAKVVSEIPGIPPNFNCAVQIGNTVVQAVFDIGCSDGDNLEERFRNYAESKGKSLGWKLVQSAISCVTSYFDKYIKSLREDLKMASQLGNANEANRLLDRITAMKALRDNIIVDLYNGVVNSITGLECLSAFKEQKPNCPPKPGGGGGSSTPVQPVDPNDIFGYTAESGSHAVKDSLTDVYYRIEFENDTAFATASAHDICVTDTLDATKFDLSTFRPTRVRIGEKIAELTGEKNFVTTIDMRPEINAIAQVEGTFDDKKGIARWHISSLDPMTMEPTDDVMQGVLPVNVNGSGMGELMFDISLKPGLAHGTEINNRAAIVFDQNDVIMTPTWTNTIDRVKPVSRIAKVEQVDGGPTATVSIEATDDGSGPWRYNVYVQYGSGAWFVAAENIPADTTATVKVYEDVVHHFYCVCTDMAGNVEEKEPVAEATLSVGTVLLRGDQNGDGQVNAADVWTLMGIIARGETPSEAQRADVNGDGRIDIGDVNSIIAIMAR